MSGGGTGAAKECDPHRVYHQAEVIGLGKEGNAPLFYGAVDSGVTRSSGEEYHSVSQVRCDFQEPIVERKAADLGHQDIAHDGIRRGATADVLQCRPRRPGLVHAEAGPLKERPHGAAHRRLIVDDQDSGHRLLHRMRLWFAFRAQDRPAPGSHPGSN